MAFGFGFNKQKALSAAEKFVQQGKLANAIAEYEKVLKADPKDLTVSNTVGDLYSRLGQADRAVECFKSVGDAYATQGFTVKAIAMYKKLAKLKPTLESILRLAELYTQQGLFNDARAQYLQVAEEFLRSGELDQAVRIFQKTLEMDPENVAMRTRLAEVYIRLNKKTEAWQLFAAAADTLRAKGQLAQTEEILQRMLTLDPGNSYALLLRGRNAFDTGDLKTAIANLEKVADLDTHPDGLRALMQAYLQSGRIPDAGALAAKLYTVHNDAGAITSYAEALMTAGRYEEVLPVYRQYSDRLLAGDSSKVLETLHSLIGHVRENPSALEALLELFQKAGDNTHLTEVYELLGHACVQSGDLEKARDYYLKLTQLEPQNQLHAQNYQQVLARLQGGAAPASKLITAEEGSVLVDELEATAPFIDQRYADDVALAVRAALTDAELFVSYNMPAKALGPLASALPKAPHDLRLNQRLAALHTRAGRFAEAALCCHTLAQLYHDAGHPDEATRYGELASKYEERASAGVPASRAAAESVEAKAAELAAPVSVPPAASGLFWHTPAEASAAGHADFEIQSMSPAAASEIDISGEWEGEQGDQGSISLAEEVPEAPTVPKSAPANAKAIDDAIEEVSFYLGQSMVEQARMVFARLEKLRPQAALSALRQEIETASAQAASLGQESLPATTSTVAPEPQLAMAEAGAGTHPEHAGALGEFVSDLEASLGDSFLPQAPLPLPQAPPEARPAPGLVSEPEAMVQTGAAAAAVAAMAAAAPAPAVESAAPAATFKYQRARPRSLAPEPATKPESAAGVDLADMFGELKQELEEDTAAVEEDPETHYNLGVAFREMGLLDEAIAELQKVCQAVDRGHPFPQLMQTYTWLAQCFLDKSVPEAAIRWYERALKLNGIDEETRIALNYEVASAYESAGNKAAALSHFLEVYGSNIDYRDVAERIKTLKS